MESQRSLLVIGFLLVSYLLWVEYQDTYGPKPATMPAAQTVADQGIPSVPSANTGSVNSSVPTGSNTASATDIPSSPSVVPQVTEMQTTNTERFVTVNTDTLSLTIDLTGGDVVRADLVKYPVTQDSDDSYELLKPDLARLHIAQSGLVGAQGPDASPLGRPSYTTSSSSFEMTGDTLNVPLTWTSADGLTITKTFVFTRDAHVIDVNYDIINNTGAPATMSQFAQLKQTTLDQEGGSMFMPIYRGGTYSTADDIYEKINFGDFQDEKIAITTQGGWVGMIEHYFVSAWVPPQEENNTLSTRIVDNNFGIIGFTGEPITVQANSEGQLSARLYVGPKTQSKLAEIARGLDYTVDYGILWWLSQPLFALLTWIQGIVINWGLAIICVTIVVKGAMYWLTKKQYESMAKMRNLQPKMAQLKERFGDDRQKMSQAMMEMYKKEKVNPMGGCFPLLLQMPIFLALYWVLLESVELRHADFIFWITDLSVADPYYVLPILTGASMFLLQRLQPMTITDPLQQKIMTYMPVAMSIFFFFFPAGLVLYWLISNLITLVQAKLIYASMEKRGISAKG
ncbi:MULTISPECIES: membrane protein insertase YidC [Alteromonadaceae]|jgi:YidC/Oxa1 family membrane protein insertase|uniref:Membrane protein insertase YidC n=1 Tax=Brumicola blandensis TaxID=3075611 RepID=A0AAW8R820_9ALTE|nr:MULTISPECIES: membrane protein insertase YidC [unclassified Alteromonas]MDT0584271.1 membrane protein insertase YidC [Alteromonas sp. W409]MDT0630027.1 membrane protein insertase YidC [Alteromonas sp. W364]